MKKSEGIAWLCVSIACFFLMSASILFMPINFVAVGMKYVDHLIGISFWVFLSAGIATQIVLNLKRLAWLKKNKIRANHSVLGVGLITFMKNAPACVADGAVVVSLFCLVISSIATEASGYICCVFAALLSFSFCMHCILNGKIYHFLKNRDRILKNSKKHIG